MRFLTAVSGFGKRPRATGLLLVGAVLLWAGCNGPQATDDEETQAKPAESKPAGVRQVKTKTTEVKVLTPVGQGAARQWPQWRGPSRQGVVESGGYTDRWSDEESVVWRVEVPGRGHSSPIIWNDRIFLTTAYDQFLDEPIGQILSQSGDRVFLDEREQVRSVLCFRRSDGELLWETFVPYVAAPEEGWPKSSYASSTPVTDGQRVYAYFGNHGLLAVDSDGNVVWHNDLGEISNVARGTACSPLLYEDRVIVFQDHGGPGGSFIAALDRETGEELWRTGRTARVGWSSPIAIHVPTEDGYRDEIITSSQHDPRAELLRRGHRRNDVPPATAGRGRRARHLQFAHWRGRQGIHHHRRRPDPGGPGRTGV